MKQTIFLLLTFLAFDTMGQNTAVFVETENVSIDVIAPKGVYHLPGIPKQKNATNVVFQKDGEDIGVYGKLAFLSKGENASVYVCEGIRFLLSNAQYRMCATGKFLETSSGQSVEALIVDISTEYECERIYFTKDSITKNILPNKKLVMDLPPSAIKWEHMSYSVSPMIESGIIDSLDLDGEAFYTLAIKNEEDKVCSMFKLEREKTQIDGVKKIAYKIPEKENHNFSARGEEEYFFKETFIAGYFVLKDFGPKSKKIAKKMRHKKRTKI